MKFNKNEFGWKEKVNINTDELVTKNDIPHYNETLMFEISGDDYRFFRNNNYFNMSALNIDETKLYVGKDIDITDDEEYTFNFVYDKEADTLISEDTPVHIHNHKSYDGENFIEDENSAVLAFNITPMILGFEGEGYFRLYEVEKLELDNKCLPNDVNIKNSLTVGSRMGDIGIYSVAEGAGTTASGEMSHAEGDSSIASNYASHAEGGLTIASGYYAHTEGYNTRASGNYSHAEGSKTTASGSNSHAEGESSNSISAVISDFSPSTSNDVILTAWNNGQFSLAKSEASHVEGKDNLALGECSHAEGDSTTASGIISHAEGLETIAGGNSSHAEGLKTIAGGNSSHAEGFKTTAIGNSSHAEGEASNLATDIIQNLSSSTTNDDILTAWNSNKFSLAGSISSHVEGKDNLALGECSHAEGGNTTASSDYSHAEGVGSIASGMCSHAEGIGSTADGMCSHAEGNNTIANSEGSHAEGDRTIASSENQHVQGKNNIEDTENKYAHIVGNGMADTARSNAHTLDWNGNGWYKGELYTGGTSQSDANKVLTTANISFNDSGELVVTIGDVTKTFVPKQ